MKVFPNAFLSTALTLSIALGFAMALTPKKIICSFDGSGCSPYLNRPRPAKYQEPSEKNPKDPNADHNFSNVLKLHLLAGGSIDGKTNAVDGQICLYEKGVAGFSEYFVVREVRMALGFLSQQTKPMKEKLEACYEEGDELYITGFSRGSAAARVFVMDLCNNGLKTKSGGHVEKPPVKMLGCFDTVSEQVWKNEWYIFKTAALGNGITSSKVLNEKGGNPGDIVETAVHNLSLDDARFKKLPAPFSPVFMNSKNPKVHETWFAGIHGDVGGNYYLDGVSDCSGNYMKEWLDKCGVTFIDPSDVTKEAKTIPEDPDFKVTARDVSIRPRPNEHTHIQDFLTTRKSLRPVVTAADDKVIEGGTVRVHRSVLDHLKDMKETGRPYLFNGNLKKTDFKVIGTFDNVLEKETEELKALLPVSECREPDEKGHESLEEEMEKIKAEIEAQVFES